MSDLTEAQSRIEAILLEFAEAVFPAWQHAKNRHEYLNSGPWRYSDDPRNAQVEALLEEDSLLRTMHPSPRLPYLGRRGYIDSDSGGGTLQSSNFVSGCILEAWDDTWLSGQEPTVTNFKQSVSMLFRTLLKGLAGETIKVKIRCGIGGVALPASMPELELPHGFIRTMPERWLERRCDPDFRRDGSQPVLAIFETEITTPLTIVPEPDTSESAPATLPPEPWALRRKWWRNLRFALALVKQTPVEESWQYAFLRVGGGFQDMTPTSPLTPKPLTVEEALEWQRLAKLVDGAAIDNIEVALDRTATMLDGSEHPFDQLLNSVMVWESLVSGAPETTFRICASLSWVLERDVARRDTRYKELSAIYGLRSDVVHGKKHLPASKNATAYSARPLTIQILKEFIEYYPALIKLKTSDERSRALLLSGDDCRKI